MTVKQGVASITSNVGKNNFSTKANALVGKVYGVVTTENTPTAGMFQKAGGFNGIGTIFYLNYNQSKNITGSFDDSFLSTCKTAKPLNPQLQYFPLIGELVYLENLPSPSSQVAENPSQKYYISTIKLWGNSQDNSQLASSNSNVGITFKPNPNVRPLLSFEGDHIIQGRQGSTLRFSSTTKLYRNINEWSKTGEEYDPITILTNGLAYDPNKQFYVEQINKDASSIYLTTTQKIPLEIGPFSKVGVFPNPIKPQAIQVSEYFGSQVIINSDRVVINSKKDDVLLFGKTNIELSTNNTINLNAAGKIHLNSDSIYLGTVNYDLPTEPLLLGNKTVYLLSDLIEGLAEFSTTLSSAVATSEGSPLIDINTASTGLLDDLSKLSGRLIDILSTKNYTA
jgi:hypothetical protein